VSTVALVSMPFGPLFWPSLGLSLLKPRLVQDRVPVSLHYFTIPFGELIGERLYTAIAMNTLVSMRELAGEWIFADALEPQTPEQSAAYVRDILTRRDSYLSKPRPVPRWLVGGILRARARVNRFLDRCADDVCREEPAIVGFTSVFQQHTASLALAARVKARRPGTLIVFGGANCEGVMGAETLRQYGWVDVAVSGEGDDVFPELVRRHLAGAPISGLAGVRTRSRLREDFAFGRFSSADPVRDMDSLPYPDFSDYFEQFGHSRFEADWQPGTFIETSRGCWWGERMHCTFCGLNGATMAFRSKSAARALDEMTTLAARHPGADMQVVDNILDLAYFKTLVPELARRKLDLNLFYETKSNLKRDQIRMLHAAGIRRIQPGIESFSDAILKLMGKGVTGLHNIQLLKWCKEFGVTPLWNFIWGFPGEPAEEYARMARLVPLLSHLPPPSGFSGLRLDRFSPNFADPQKHGFTDVVPFQAYSHVFSARGASLANLAYYFRFAYGDGRDPAAYANPLVRGLRRWQRAAPASDLFSVDTGSHLVICDLRPGVSRPFAILDGLDRAVYLACDSIADRQEVQRAARRATGTDADDRALDDALDGLVARAPLLQDGNRFLNLAVPLGTYTPAQPLLDRFSRVVRSQGRRQSGAFVIPVASRREPMKPRRESKRHAARASRWRALDPSQFSVNPSGDLVISPFRAVGERRA
jgi:ribosomal peptide maturation radical SAM protein 1